MKKYLPAVISGFIMCILGFVIGYEIAEKSYTSASNNLKTNITVQTPDSLFVKSMTYGELKEALIEKEKESIIELQQITGDIDVRKEGPVFSRETSRYLRGTLINKALLLPVKDIQVSVEFYSQTGTLIGNETVVIYEFIPPFIETEYEVKIKTPDEFNSVKLKVESVKPAINEGSK